MKTKRAVIAGAGIAGLAAAIDLARAGVDVTVVEAQPSAGGKIRQVESGGALFDAGPTVLTMRWVFDQLFSDAGASFSDAVTATPLHVLARHAWDDKGYLDLFSDAERSADAIGAFAGAKEAAGYRAFAKRAADTYRTLEGPFILSDQPNPVSLAMGAGLKGLGDLWRISPFTTLWNALGEHFADERLRQLFARYATYVGSSPFDAPATLMLIADVERQGVYILDGGMHALASACQALAVQHGVKFRFGERVTRITTEFGRFRSATLHGGDVLKGDAVIINADPSAVSRGLFGPQIEMAAANHHRAQRSLSAITFCFRAKSSGLPLEHHNVFFCRNYQQEFDDVFRYARIPADPTVYICAQDRGHGTMADDGAERLFCLVNAPAIGDVHEFTQSEIRQCEQRLMSRINRCGLQVSPASDPVLSTPSDFNRLFPATGGALYGQTSHGWTASFTRPSARTRCPGLYLAGGGTHPGAGVPMAATSGRIAARAVFQDLTSA
jgi:1-hydroxycarotenoid 3,4-desaturase